MSSDAKASLASHNTSPLIAILQALASTSKPSDMALIQAREAINRELELRARSTLELSAAQYMGAFGADEGIRTMAEDLCRYIAPIGYSGGWKGIVKHIVEISG